MTYTTLIDADTLHAHGDDSDWVVFDCRFSLDNPKEGAAEYRRAHVPGALYANLDRDLSAPKKPDTGRHPLPDVAAFSRWLGASGVDAASQVVVYDDAGGMIAARLWWMLRWVGHPAVAVLDGGWGSWNAAGYPVTDKIPAPEEKTFRASVDHAPWLGTGQLETELADGRIRLIDARAAARYRGEKEPIDPRAGHVPGAVNRPFTDNLDAEGRFLDPESLRRRFEADTTQAPGGRIVHMCGSGVSACHNLLAMAVAGLPESRLYVGSWSEWVANPERPVATGEGG